MPSRRTARVASVIREVVSTTILNELRDPRIKYVTVLGADVSPDLRYAKIRISVMGTEKDAALTLHGLESARGYLQSKVAERVKTRYTPELRFEIDDGVRKSIEATRILREVLPDREDEAASVTESASRDESASESPNDAASGGPEYQRLSGAENAGS
ncbi:MAG: 30S ribosome-binding factor RbfA [Planctomycetaceae bacterium]